MNADESDNDQTIVTRGTPNEQCKVVVKLSQEGALFKEWSQSDI